MSDGKELVRITEIAVPVVKGVYSVLKKEGIFDKVVDWLKRRHPYHLILLGASGVGKSSVRQSLQGMDPYILPADRTQKVEERRGRIQDAVFNLIDTPGEDAHRGKRLEAIRKAAQQTPLGVLNIVSYGYHEGVGLKKLAVEKHERIVRPEFLTRQKQKELDHLDEWTSLLCGEGGAACWVITVITKADLWWTPDSEQEVVDYYTHGEYHQSLGEVQKSLHYVRPYSSLNQLFHDQVPMSGFYSDTRRKQDRESLIALILKCAAQDRG